MPSCLPKKTRFAPGTKSHGPDEVLDVAYLQGLLVTVKTGIQNEKRRARKLSDQNVKFQKYLIQKRRDEEKLLAKLEDIKCELRKEKSRAAWLEHKSKSWSESQSMGQNSNCFQAYLPGNHWTPHSLYSGNLAFTPAPCSQVSPSYMSHGGFVNRTMPQHSGSHGNRSHFQHPPSLPHPPPSNYFPNPHFPQPGNPMYMRFPGPQHYSGWMEVPQYSY
ncbi:unnamed protein product [Blumeria hordei]|uniref:Uncharacterized protein n=1 Tax=Blumeria hordei TaxID=2867405 RepID=A0A383UYB6_BLUHO|nr:unnamed protein product [Blumeria hordei]